MEYWSCTNIDKEQLQYIKDVFLYRSLGQQEFERGEKLYDEGVKLGLWTNRVKSIHAVVYRSRKTNNLTISVKTRSGKHVLQVLMKEHEYQLIVKGGK